MKRRTNWKTRRQKEEPQGSYLDSLTLRGLKNTLIICVTEENHTFYYVYRGPTTALLVTVHC